MDSDNFKRPTSKTKNLLNEIFKNAKQKDLIDFFKKNIKYHKDLEQELITEFIGVLDSRDVDRYQNVIDRFVKNACREYGYVDGNELSYSLNGLLRQAGKSFVNKNYLDTLNICIAIFVKIPNLLLTVDDSSGALQGNCYDAMQRLFDLYNGPIAPTLKDQIFDLMLETFEKDKTGFDFRDDLLSTLLEQKIGEEQLIRCQHVVQKAFDALEGDHIEYSQEFYLITLIKIAEKLGNNSVKDDLINQNLHFSGIRKLQLFELLKKNNFDAAKVLVNKGITIAEEKSHGGTVNELREELIQISRLEKDIEEERRLLLLAHTQNRNNIDYYQQLKKTYKAKAWIAVRNEIILDIIDENKNSDYFRAGPLADIYVEEKLWSNLLELLQTDAKSTSITDEYGKYLNKKYPEEMLKLYEEIILNEAANTGKRWHYASIAKRLNNLKKIKGGRAVAVRLLELLNLRYIRRPAMIDELRAVKV